jgi:uncharacterized protein (DUF58 family)
VLLTRRGLILLLLAALPLGTATFWLPAAFLAVAYLVCVVGLLVLDVVISPKRSDFELSRSNDSKLSLGADNAIQIHIANRSPWTVSLKVRDEFPVAFRTDQWEQACTVEPFAEALLTYHLKPLRRGDYRFGDLNLRYIGRLGLIQRQERYPATASVKVYPNLLDIRRYELLARRGHLAEIGLRNARVLGRGTEFERLRDYQTDDDYRRINWKATARRGRPVSVEYETERSQNIVLMLDAGRPMATPVGPLAKLDYSVNTALMLAYVATRLGDNVGMLAFADRINTHLPPRRGKRQFLAMLEALYDLPVQHTEPDYALAFQYFGARQRKRALIVLFTDLLDKETSRTLVNYLARQSPHHLVMCVAISDPDIVRMASTTPHDSREVYQKAVAEDLLLERRRAIEDIRRRGGFIVDVPADQLTGAVVNKYLELKLHTRL